MISFKVVIGSLFGLLVVAIAVLGVSFYQDSQDRVIAAGRVSHGYEAIDKTEEIYSAFKDAQLEAGLLADLNDTASTEDYRPATLTLYSRIEELRDLITHNDLTLRIDSLEALIRQFTPATGSLKVYVDTSSEAAKSLKTTPHNASAKEIEAKIRDLKDIEGTMLAQRKLALQEKVSAFMRTLGMLIVTIAILLAATFLTVRYNFNKRKAAEDQIKDALQAEVELNRMKSSFVTLASHEFRTPLTTILSSAFLLEKYSFGVNQDKAVKHLARIKSSVSNLTSILDEFLSVTKIEDGQVQPNIETVDLQDFLGTVCNDLQRFAKPGQTIHYSHTGAQEVKTDPVLLGNIIRNIVTNSIKYSPESSAIYVSSTVNSKVHVSVQDNGIGIPSTDQKSLFERFYRASNAGAVQGTGLGLHIMKHYVQMLKGSVKLQSEVGKGTRVEVTFDHTNMDLALP
jgi:signal transduction histidine kinase